MGDDTEHSTTDPVEELADGETLDQSERTGDLEEQRNQPPAAGR
jgi:hypothetical protein